MWKPEESKALAQFDAALIERDYADLLFADFPVLFTGRNRAGSRILGSSVEEERATEASLHAEVSDETFDDFVARRISYPEALRRARSLYLIHRTGGEPPKVWGITFSDIPEEYRPHETAFCPDDVELTPDADPAPQQAGA